MQNVKTVHTPEVEELDEYFIEWELPKKDVKIIKEHPELIELVHAFLSRVSYWDGYDKYEYNIITDFSTKKKNTKVKFR